MEGSDILEYFELQGSLAMVTKSELLEHVRQGGGHISDRQLTTFVSEGLIPKSMRIGSRAGAYPKIIEELLLLVIELRDRGVSIEAIRELLPVWRFLRRSLTAGEVNLAELEYIARQTIRLPEAAYNVPILISLCLPWCPVCDQSKIEELRFIDKAGVEHHHRTGHPMTIGFLLGQHDEAAGVALAQASVRIVIPTFEASDDPTTVILGAPNGVAVRRHDDQDALVLPAGDSHNESGP